MSQYKARRTFRSFGRFFQKGSTVDLEPGYLTRLERRRLVYEVPAAPVPSETKIIAPAQTQTIAPAETQPPQPPEEPKVETSTEAPESPQVDAKPFEELSRKELNALAKTAGIKGYNTMKTDDIIKQLKERG